METVNPWSELLAIHSNDLAMYRKQLVQGYVAYGFVAQRIELVESLWNAWREHQGTYNPEKPARLPEVLPSLADAKKEWLLNRA